MRYLKKLVRIPIYCITILICLNCYTEIGRASDALPDEPYALFETLPVQNQGIAESLPSHVNRNTRIRLNSDYFRNKNLSLDLFGEQVVVVRDRVVDNVGGNAVWVGHIKSKPGSSIVLSKRSKGFSGTIHYNGKLFEIEMDKKSASDAVLSEINEEELPPDIHKQVPDADFLPDEALPANAVAAAASNIVDLMVVYTPSSCNKYGRDVGGGCANLESKIVSAVAAANTAYNNSQVNMQLNLVRMQEISYSERGIENSLNDLTGTNDGQMDNVHTLRNTYGADQVALISEDSNACGVAWQMSKESAGFAAYAFSVVFSDCLAGQTLAHELGHNQGDAHDPDNAGGQGAFPYSFGHRICGTGGFRTIMSYSCLGANRIDFFSNPNLSFNGQPIGIADQRDNSRSMNETVDTVSAWRGNANPAPGAPSNLTSTLLAPDTIRLTWQDNANSETGFRIERSTDNSTWKEIATVAANVIQYDDNGLAANTFFYRVRSFSGSGNSAYSNTTNTVVPGTGPTVPATPTGLTATAASSTQVNLAWTDASNNETGFKIERCSGTGCTNFAQIGTTGANAAAFQDTGLTANTVFQYRVQATSAAGDSAFSNTATITTASTTGGGTVPAAPTNLVAIAQSNRTITLSWTDASNNETGFRIEYCGRSSTCTNFVSLGRVRANATRISLSGAAPSTFYRFRILALGSSGNSAYSNIATVRTP